MGVKIDLEKTYDKMEWAFVKEMLREAGLSTGMINVTMGLICQSSCRLI